MKIPLVADVKRHSLEDGPGIRSVVFFKGCPLRCVFCHNHEMQRPERELVFRVERCIRCGCCEASCPTKAVSLDRDERIDRSRCDDCGECVIACPSSALAHVGRSYEVAELVEELMRDEAYYRTSGGGITFSGGECTMFPDYLEALARALKRRGAHLLVETSGEFDGGWFVARLLPLVDLIYFDLKLADAGDHRVFTGASNQRIWENLALLLRRDSGKIEVRIPLVPEITTPVGNLTALGRRLRALGVGRATLLPYNPLGREMAQRLGRPQPAVSGSFMRKEAIEAAIVVFEQAVAEHHDGKSFAGAEGSKLVGKEG